MTEPEKLLPLDKIKILRLLAHNDKLNDNQKWAVNRAAYELESRPREPINEEAVEQLCKKVYVMTIEELTKTLGCVSFVKITESYRPKSFEEIYRQAKDSNDKT